MKITDWPVNERPREKLLQKGPTSLSDAELLAIFLQSGAKGQTAVDLGRALLARYKSIRKLVDADQADLCSMRGLGIAKYVGIKAALELGRRYLQEQITRSPPITSPDITRDFLKSRLMSYQHEVFSCIFMDNRHALLAFEELFSGTIDGASVYPREVVKRCLQHNAAAVIFAHNHPSGIAEPSQADIAITQRLKEALALVEIRVLDHFVVGTNSVISLAERGLL
jgi:DNA repair protein RadC